MLSCQDYDYIEIVCMYRYPLRLILKSGATVEGIALDTARNEQRQECIKLEGHNQQQLIVLDSIASLMVMVENPHVNQITFD
ncbi:MAG: Rho-binding antiterminator [Psychromonas sp.]